VTFSFCDNKYKGSHPHTLGPCSKPTSEGGDTISFQVSDFESAGLTSSAAKVAVGIAKSEADGNWGNLNTYDSQYVSWGAFQYSGLGGPLGIVLAFLATSDKFKDSYNTYLGSHGVKASFIDPKHHGWGAVLTVKDCDGEKDPGCASGGEEFKVEGHKPDGWIKLQNRIDILGLLYIMGHDKNIALGEVVNWYNSIALGALGTKIADHPAGYWVTSEWAAARYLYAYNGNPMRVINIVKKYATDHPEPWDEGILDAFAVEAGSGQSFTRFDAAVGSQLSHAPGSFH